MFLSRWYCGVSMIFTQRGCISIWPWIQSLNTCQMIYQISHLHVSGIRNIKHHTLHDLFVENSAKTTLPPTRKHQQQTSKQSNEKLFSSDAITKSWRGTYYTIYKNPLKPVQQNSRKILDSSQMPKNKQSEDSKNKLTSAWMKWNIFCLKSLHFVRVQHNIIFQHFFVRSFIQLFGWKDWHWNRIIYAQET